jgi:hypothetical protein
MERQLDGAVRRGWLICQSRPYVVDEGALSTNGGVNWQALAGRSKGRRGYLFGDLTRAACRRVSRGPLAGAPKFKYAVLDASGVLYLYEPLGPLPSSTELATDERPRLRLARVMRLDLHGAAISTLWPSPCAVSYEPVDECVLPDEETAAAVSEVNARDMAARGISESDADGRPLHTFTIASSAVGEQAPKTWRLSAHSLNDAEGWAEALAKLSHAEDGTEPAVEPML